MNEGNETGGEAGKVWTDHLGFHTPNVRRYLHTNYAHY